LGLTTIGLVFQKDGKMYSVPLAVCALSFLHFITGRLCEAQPAGSEFAIPHGVGTIFMFLFAV